MEGRVCNKCRQFKTVDSFYLNKRNKPRSECKDCANSKSLERYRKKKESKDIDFVVARMASSLIARTKTSEFYLKNNIKNRLGTHDDIVKLLNENHLEDIKRIINDGDSPSIDRINPKGVYTSNNIRVITLHENQILGFETAWTNNRRGLTCIYPNGEKEEFKSIIDAHKGTGLDRKTIRDSLNLERKTRFGYMFTENERGAK